jgi:hypothetical protein
MTPEEHGKLRAGKVTASVAHIIDTGGMKAWQTLAKKLWSDDGTDFAKNKGGARQYGHEHEAEGAAKFWEKHPEYEIIQQPWFDYTGDITEFRGFVGASPDRIILLDGKPVGGLEIKSPTKLSNMAFHTPIQHYPQCAHGMLVTGLTEWVLFAHHGDTIREYKLRRDPSWEMIYVGKLRKFLQFLNEGRKTRRRTSIDDIPL